MLNARTHPTNHNGHVAKTKPVEKPKVKPCRSAHCVITSSTAHQGLITPNYPSSVAKPLAPWPRDQGDVSDLYKVTSRADRLSKVKIDGRRLGCSASQYTSATGSARVVDRGSAIQRTETCSNSGRIDRE